jgi:hypothetical protein
MELISAGGGIDIQINPNLYIRGELRWGFRLKNDKEESLIALAKLFDADASFFSAGPKITLAIGYSL